MFLNLGAIGNLARRKANVRVVDQNYFGSDWVSKLAKTFYPQQTIFGGIEIYLINCATRDNQIIAIFKINAALHRPQLCRL